MPLVLSGYEEIHYLVLYPLQLWLSLVMPDLRSLPQNTSLVFYCFKSHPVQGLRSVASKKPMAYVSISHF